MCMSIIIIIILSSTCRCKDDAGFISVKLGSQHDTRHYVTSGTVVCNNKMLKLILNFMISLLTVCSVIQIYIILSASCMIFAKTFW